MNNTLYTYLLFLGVIFLTAQSCERELVIDPSKGVEKRMVANCIFSNEGTFQIELTRPFLSFQSKNIIEIEDAQVKLSSGGVSEYCTYKREPNKNLGYYVSKRFPQPFEKYSIRIDAPGYPGVTAESSLPGRVKVIGKYVEKITGIGIPKEAVRYKFSIVILDSIRSNDNYYLTISAPILKTDMNSGAAQLYTRQYCEINLSSLENYTPYLRNGILFSDEELSANAGVLTGTVTTSIYPLGDFIDDGTLFRDTTYLIFRLHHLSEELHSFYKSHAASINSLNDPFTLPVPVYSNIDHGLGIFGGAYISEETLKIQ